MVNDTNSRKDKWMTRAMLLVLAIIALLYYVGHSECEHRGGVLVYTTCLKKEMVVQ